MSEVKTNWAMGAPAALYVIGAACFGLFALLTGLVPGTAIPVMAVWLIAAAVAIFICGIIDLARGDLLLGTMFVVFAALIFLGGGLSFNATLALGEGMLAGFALSGWVWLGIGIIVLLFLPSVGRVSWSLFLFVLVLAVAVIMVALGFISGPVLGTGLMLWAGILIGLFGLYTLYVGTVFVLNTVAGAPKLAIGGPIFK